MTINKRRYGFKSRKQLDWFMIWDEEWIDGKVVYARVVFALRYPYGIEWN